MTARSSDCFRRRLLRLARHNTHHDLLLPTPLLPQHPPRRILCTFAWPLPMCLLFPRSHLVLLESLSLADCSPSATRAPFLSRRLRSAPLVPCLRGPLRQGVPHNIPPSFPSVKLFPSLFSLFTPFSPFSRFLKSFLSLLPRVSQLFVIL